MLKKITLDYVGPAKHMEVDFADRLTVITGDNSLGKSLLLDTGFFASSNEWPSEVPIPWMTTLNGTMITGSVQEPIKLRLDYKQAGIKTLGNSRFGNDIETKYAFSGLKKYWLKKKISLDKPEFCAGIVVYYRANGGFSVCDPIRREFLSKEDLWASFHLTPSDIWQGAETKGRIRYCKGLISDWIDWKSRKPDVFRQFEQLFALLDDDSDGFFLAEDTIRLPGGDVTDWPALKTPYGEVAILHISDAVKRILSLCYMLVWTCYEHRMAAEANGVEPEKHLIVILDEIEAHLHPTWQRLILPALLKVGEAIPGFTIQFIVTTHSPMVLAGLEPVYDQERDKILHLKREGADVSLETLPFHPYGTASEWLMSPVFGLEEARNLPAQTILRQARDLMRQPKSEATEQQAKELEPELIRLIPSIDPFWTGWHFFWHGLPGHKNDSA